MTLEEINTRLPEIVIELKDVLPKLQEAERAYNRAYFDVLMHSGMGNAQARDAEAKQACDTQGLTEPFEELKIELRTLLHEKECLIEIAKNIRSLRGNEYA